MEEQVGQQQYVLLKLQWIYGIKKCGAIPILDKRGHLTDDILSDSEETSRSYGKSSNTLDGDGVGRS